MALLVTTSRRPSPSGSEIRQGESCSRRTPHLILVCSRIPLNYALSAHFKSKYCVEALEPRAINRVCTTLPAAVIHFDSPFVTGACCCARALSVRSDVVTIRRRNGVAPPSPDVRGGAMVDDRPVTINHATRDGLMRVQRGTCVSPRVELSSPNSSR
jgi:hypothetical protein